MPTGSTRKGTYASHYEKWLQLALSGISFHKIADQFGTTATQISNRVKKMVKDRGIEFTKCVSPCKFKTMEESYLSHVIKNKKGCWGWNGCKRGKGYSVFTFRGKLIGASIFAYKHYVGDTKGLFVCHKCDNPECSNPEHLFLGSNADNIKDCRNKGQHPSFKLTLEKVSNLKKELAKKEYKSLAALGRKYGVSGTTVSQLKRGIIWSDVSAEDDISTYIAESHSRLVAQSKSSC